MEEQIKLTEKICKELEADSFFTIYNKGNDSFVDYFFNGKDADEAYIRRAVLSVSYLLFKDLKTIKEKSDKASEIMQDIMKKFVM